MDLENEASWLRSRIIRLRAALRFAKEPRTDMILREFIAEAEERLGALEDRGVPSPPKRTIKPPKISK
jgi:hypothetical protein